MSRGQVSRTPLHFPRMKHRARGRIFRREALAAMPFIMRSLHRETKAAAAHLAGMAEAFQDLRRKLS